MNLETEFRHLIAERSKLRCIVTETGPKWGGSFEVSDECAERWAEPLRLIEAALKLTADSDGGQAKPKGRNKNLPVAKCECGDSIRLSLKTLEKCKPMCQECETEFKVEEADDN